MMMMLFWRIPFRLGAQSLWRCLARSCTPTPHVALILRAPQNSTLQSRALHSWVHFSGATIIICTAHCCVTDGDKTHIQLRSGVIRCGDVRQLRKFVSFLLVRNSLLWNISQKGPQVSDKKTPRTTFFYRSQGSFDKLNKKCPYGLMLISGDAARQLESFKQMCLVGRFCKAATIAWAKWKTETEKEGEREHEGEGEREIDKSESKRAKESARRRTITVNK